MFNRAISNAMAGNVDAELATDLVLLHTIVCERMCVSSNRASAF